jgi:LAS superfamily LD-carboxypeptidase LdcB
MSHNPQFIEPTPLGQVEVFSSPPVNADAFANKCRKAAVDYAVSKVSLPDAVDALQHFAFTRGLVERLGQDSVQAIMAKAFERIRAADDAAEVDDEYAGLIRSFARQCAIADADYTARHKPTPEQQQWRLGASVSTLRAARYLIQQNNAVRLQEWLSGHTARERLAIIKHIKGRIHAQH